MNRKTPVSAAIVLVAGLSAQAARAEVGDVALTWDAPAGCPTADDVRGRIAGLHATAAAPPRPVQAQARISGRGNVWRMELSLVAGQAASDRVLEGTTCQELADAAALLVVLASDVEAQSPQPNTAPPRPSPPAVGPAEPRPDVDGPRPPPAPSRRTVRLAVRLFGAGDAASLPSPAMGLGAAAALDVGPVRGEIAALWMPGREAMAATEAGADVSLAAVVPRGCWVPQRGAFELGTCLGLELGSLRAEAFGVSEPRAGSAVWLAPELALLGAVELGPAVHFVAGVEAAVPLARERFVLLGVGDVHQAPPVTARAVAGLELRP